MSGPRTGKTRVTGNLNSLSVRALLSGGGFADS
eukprot:CAMPEP_0196739470 /NCGR_PEP_ID=MMETSP1091-20130531/22832_1 /TAXON_ID=302021 /ORGANISM="Rhodomonas sp., Strain CCMP768" /LENGTH=32 /DNA_ID= /DNA_START= /DNA_END= /DNA_ORIENTATION=